MEKGFLEDCLAKGMSLEAIGERAGKHPSTVSHWLKKYGLKASKAKRHTSKGGIERGSLEALVGEGLTLREMADQLDRSATTVRYWMNKYELKTIRRKRSRSAGDPPKVEMLCRHHGRTEFALEGRGYYRCALCGYSRCVQALHFHHLDALGKTFQLGFQGHSRSLDRSREEARKCALLCANCHAEVEAGLASVSVSSITSSSPK